MTPLQPSESSSPVGSCDNRTTAHSQSARPPGTLCHRQPMEEAYGYAPALFCAGFSARTRLLHDVPSKFPGVPERVCHLHHWRGFLDACVAIASQ